MNNSKLTEQVIINILAGIGPDFDVNEKYYRNAYWTGVQYKYDYLFNGTPTVEEILMCHIHTHNGPIGTVLQQTKVNDKYGYILSSSQLREKLVSRIPAHILVKDHKRILGNEIATSLYKQRSANKFKKESITLNEDAFSIAAFKQYYSTNKLTATAATNYVRQTANWNNSKLTDDIREFLWNTADTKTLTLAKELTSNFWYKLPYIKYLSVSNIISMSNGIYLSIINRMDYSTTFKIIDGVPKSNWNDNEIMLCIAYLQVLPTDHWAVNWIWTNCPITQKHLDKQPQPVTMRK